MMIDVDQEFQTRFVASAKTCKDSTTFEVTFKDCSCFLVRNPKNLPLPKVGTWLRLYGKGFGYQIRGVESYEHVYNYRSANAMHADNVAERFTRDEMKRRKWNEDAEATEVRLLALPTELRDRFDYFNKTKDWGWDNGPYELMVSEQAAWLEEDVKDLQAFSEMSHEDQCVAFPRLDKGHSGNSFAVAYGLAVLLRNEPHRVIRTHGALCGLVGCKKYGCSFAEETK